MEDNKNLKYTQEDMDNIVSKVKASQKEKYEKTHVDKTLFEELNQKYESLIEEKKISDFKSKFIANNGNAQAYQDFIANHKSLIDMEDSKLEQEFKTLQETKPFFFEKQNTPTLNKVPNDNEVIKELIEDNSDLIPGTFYKKQF